MKSIKRRIGFHFSIQFVFLSVFIITVLLIVFFMLVNFLMNEDVNRNYPKGALETIATEAWIEEGKVDIPEMWINELEEKDMWMQIIDGSGEALYSANVPSSIQHTYTMDEILAIQERESIQTYEIVTYIDSLFYDQPYLYILGYQNQKQEQLDEWVQSFEEKGRVSEEGVSQIKQQMEETDVYLDVVNSEGEVLQRIGSGPSPERYTTIEIPARLSEPQNYDTKIMTKRLPETTWILHTPTEEGKWKFSSIQQILIVLISIGSATLLLLIALSIWHGIRYGQPLLLFISWLERMRNGNYEEVFTERERKKLFNKKNKIRLRYRLYKEVIQEFYDMAEQLDHAEKERLLLDQQREEWMSGISHDLRTPLTTIQGYGHMLETGYYEWEKEELKDMGETIRKKGDYMLELIQDFSLISKLKQQGLPIEYEIIDLKKTVERSLNKYQEYDTISVNVEPNTRLEANPKWIERLLDNLIINALKHNPTGTSVTITSKVEKDWIFLSIQDNGIGMDEHTQKNLFTRYFRGTNSEEESDGSGLGMSIAKAIVHAHHGSISVSSKLQKGTTIIVKFPIQQNKR
ncbi:MULTISPECIES: sensor histidine kinase [Pontibacillus]|uniref:histidine kinase n=1 Tax=Pontibacillus chungwhensis TaxID=265426 RepID=A0ABY8UY84_9BACI|nr:MULTISPECIES: HAMP domain-containing sensor histidine kinase [Pontibacillus]MCD5325110.1 HAMP domain-containing histidine kinase [Pontibacillus sp. HN14]WIF97360.1 HAMP domain-containing sensor histidine kinase [Pontibacillus chungwhensis]